MRSKRLAQKEEEEHAQAMEETKKFFSQLGEQMQLAEDLEARQAFQEECAEEEERQGRTCIMLDELSDSEDEEESDDEDQDDEGAEEQGNDGETGADADAPGERENEGGGDGGEDEDGDADPDDDDDSDEDFELPESMTDKLARLGKAFVPEAIADAVDAAMNVLQADDEHTCDRKGTTALLQIVEKGSESGAAADAFGAALGVTLAMAPKAQWPGWCPSSGPNARTRLLVEQLGRLWRRVLASKDAELDVEPMTREAIVGKLGRLAEQWSEELGVALVWEAGKKATESSPRKKRARAD